MNIIQTTRLRIQHFFASPQFENDEIRTRQAQLLAIMLNCIIFGIPILVFGNLLGGNVPLGINLLNVGAVLMAIGLRHWLTHANTTRVALATISLVLIGITLGIVVIGTIRTPTTSIFLLVVVASGFVFKRSIVFAIIALSSLAILVLILAQNAGLLPEPDTSVTIAQWITYTTLFALGGSLTFSTTQTLRHALQRVDYELTQRRQIEITLQERENQLRIITDNMQEMLLLLDVRGIIRYVNKSSWQQLGYRPENLVGQMSFNFIHPDDAAAILPLMQRIYTRENEPLLLEFRGKHADGHYVNLEATGQVLFEQDQPAGIVAVSRDITSRKQIEESLRESNVALQAQNEELDAFAHTVAHDLKGPVGVIFGFAELLLDAHEELPPAEKIVAFDHIYRNATKANSIIESLLVLAGVRKQMVELELLDMNVIVDEALRRLSLTIQETQAVITRLDADNWPYALGYGPWVEEIWINYLSNALKYGGKPPQVTLCASRQADNWVRFSVSDNGTPLNTEQRERLFAAFERLGQKQTTGHGLGLSIVRRIVEKLGGQVGVESYTGQGNVFYFDLPMASQVKG